MNNSFPHFLWRLSILLIVIGSSFMQITNAQNNDGRSALTAESSKLDLRMPDYDGTSALLWDNFLTQSTTAIVSGEWGGLPAGANQVLCADDFTIPSSTSWTIDEISSTGFYSAGSAEANSWGVAFYADNAGTPGSLIQAETVTVTPGNTNPAGFLSNPVILNSGGTETKFWVSIYGINNTATTTTGFRWNWYSSEDPEILSEPYLRDDAGFFGGTAGWVTFTSLGLPQYNAMMFQLFGTASGGCPIEPPTNPSPADGATDVSINPGNATWTNGAGATSIEVYFGELGNLAMVYSGAPISSLGIPGPLSYNTEYGWRVVGLNDTCQVSGPTWTFTTEQDPALVTLFFDDFEAGIGLWTVTNNGGTCDWEVLSPPFPNSYTLPPTAAGNLLAADSDECGSGTTMNTTVTVTAPIDASMYQSVELTFDNDWRHIASGDEAHVEISTDGGSTWSSVWSQIGVSVRNSTEFIDLSPVVGLTTFNLRFRSVQPGWDWWWVVDNVKVIGYDVIPVELASFTAASVDNKVTLNWTTATETNNSGFQVERSTGSEFQAVGFVTGHGTTTEAKSYSFIDAGLKPGTYTYRLKQVDHNGQFEYSNTIEVDVVAPKEYTLNQNYPNPFNPSTMITFNLAVDSKVSLKVFDVLGQQVMTLVNNNLSAGAHEYNFDASGLNSGVYFYRIEASGVDGQNFTSVKKMILTK